MTETPAEYTSRVVRYVVPSRNNAAGGRAVNKQVISGWSYYIITRAMTKRTFKIGRFYLAVRYYNAVIHTIATIIYVVWKSSKSLSKNTYLCCYFLCNNNAVTFCFLNTVRLTGFLKKSRPPIYEPCRQLDKSISFAA